MKDICLSGRIVAAVVLVVMSRGQVAPAGLVGDYPLTCDLRDVSGNHHDGTNGPDAPTFSAGGATFSGNDPVQFFTLPINLNLYDQVTFGGEIQVTSADPIRGIMSNDQGSYGRSIDIDSRAGSTGISAFDGNGVFGGAAPNAGGDFVAVTYNHTTQTETLYVDNQVFSATGVPPIGDTFITVGRNPRFDNPFGGVIRNLFVFDSALSAAQIDQLRSQSGYAVLPGDANSDGTVSFADLLTLAQHYGSMSADWSQGDFNCDGAVNFADLLLLAQDYGKSSVVAGMSPAAAAAPVPEPAGFCMAALMAAMLRRTRFPTRPRGTDVPPVEHE